MFWEVKSKRASSFREVALRGNLDTKGLGMQKTELSQTWNANYSRAISLEFAARSKRMDIQNLAAETWPWAL